MNSFVLRLIAIITMLIDHIGAVLYPEMIFLRVIGRLAFPLFCFLIVEGYFHTRSIWKYASRLGLFALISEIPFDLAFNKSILEFSSQNVFITLFLGLLTIHFMEVYRQRGESWMSAAAFLLGCAAAYLVRGDYQYVGIMYITVLYLFRDRKLYQVLSGALVIGYLGSGSIQKYAAASMLLVLLYNGKRGPAYLKYFFYAFYPVHLLILYFIAHMT